MENCSAETSTQTPDVFSSSSTAPGDSFAKFGRYLKDFHAFEEAATSAEPHWFKDLLSLWVPSGYPSGAEGLRIAIRNGYLNFYRLGQSVARVECVSGKLRADVHYKYVLDGPPPRLNPKSPYVRLTTKNVSYRGTWVAAYEGPSTLVKWIAAVDKNHAGVEKSIVDKLVEKNDHVIDLEMALPAWTSPKVAVRMDLVAVEDGKVVFWEVKTVNDGRVRCEAEFLADKLPHVLEQLSHYRIFLADDERVKLVKDAYLETAKLLVKLRKLADAVRARAGQRELGLGSSIIAASQADSLTVAEKAALVVVGLPPDHKQAKTSWKSWKARHESKLLGKIPMRVLESAGCLKYEGAL